MTTITGFAPAKVNLALHVTGQRDDGYHLLDSLVVFAGIGDVITLRAAPDLTLTVTGADPEVVPTDARNLMIRAARWFDAQRGAALHLDKRLPAASGIGGGSSDAAATLRGLAQLWGKALPRAEDTLPLGADLPVCMAARPVRMQGIGDILTPIDGLPPLHMVLVNPKAGVSTAQVFARLARKANAPMQPVPRSTSAKDFAAWLAQQRNDLEAPASAVLPAIGLGLAQLRSDSDCLLARMSGSGATCFGLYETAAAAQQGAARFRQHHPDWWVQAGPVLTDDQSVRATT